MRQKGRFAKRHFSSFGMRLYACRRPQIADAPLCQCA
jgi:hypothetical protein